MISRSALARGTKLVARQPQLAQRRCFAAAVSTPSFLAYEQADVSGVKLAVRDSHGPTAKLAVVAKGGTRYQPTPGLAVGLEEFAFKVRLKSYDCKSRCT